MSNEQSGTEENRDIEAGSRVPKEATSGSPRRWWHQSKFQRCGGLALCLIVVGITIGVAVTIGGSGESVDRDEQIMSPTLLSSLSLVPSTTPSTAPSMAPSTAPSLAPSTTPSMTPSTAPTAIPTATPTAVPTATPTAVPTATPTAAYACYTNLTVLAEDQLDDDPLVQITYTLCPNTVFEVGFSDSNGDCCFDGQSFLSARKNTRFQCGENGNVDNNCIVTGGESHVIFFNEISDEVSNNAEFAGITFVNAARVTLFLGSLGDITFQDCIFRNHINSAVVFVSYFDFGRRLQRATGNHVKDSLAIMKEALEEHGKMHRGELEEPKGVDRALQESEGRQMVVFDGCLFEDNTQYELSPFAEFGIITIRTDFNDVGIFNTLFRDNFFGNNVVAGREGYAVSNFSTGSTVVIEDSCFIDNDFIGFGIVLAWDDSRIEFSNNAVESFDDDVICQFVATSQFNNPIMASDVTCIEPELAFCPFSVDGISNET